MDQASQRYYLSKRLYFVFLFYSLPKLGMVLPVFFYFVVRYLYYIRILFFFLLYSYCILFMWYPTCTTYIYVLFMCIYATLSFMYS